jgi:hypothetical protein
MELIGFWSDIARIFQPRNPSKTERKGVRLAMHGAGMRWPFKRMPVPLRKSGGTIKFLLQRLLCQ